MNPYRLVAPALALTLLAVPAIRAQQNPRERQVHVSVTGKGDVPTAGFTAAEFEVRENNKPVEVVRVAAAPPPTHLALVFDDSGALGGLGVTQQLRDSLKAVMAGVAKSMPGTQVALIAGADPVMMRVPFTADLAALAPAIEKFGPRPQSTGSLLEAISLTLGDMQKRKAARPVVLVFAAEDSEEAARVKAPNIEAALKAAGASLWAVVLETRSTEAMIASRDRSAVLADVSKRSGGGERRANSNSALAQAFDRVITMIASRYEVTYLRPDGATAAPSNFEVRSKKGGTLAAPRWAGQ